MLLKVSVFKSQVVLKKSFVVVAVFLALTIGVISLIYPQSTDAKTKAPVILVYGDSISAAYGMAPEFGWVNLLSERLSQNSPGYAVINASVSGETTSGGLVRLAKTLEMYQPAIVILELGGNDGLRGYPISTIEANLQAMAGMALTANAKVLLIGLPLPPNYGRRYTEAFEAIFSRVSDKLGIPLARLSLRGTITRESLMQRDGIHPKPEAQALLLDNIWQYLEKLL